MMGKEDINRRLGLSFGLLILIFCVYGVYSLYENHTVSKLTRTIYDHPLVVSNAALQSAVSIIKMHRDMKDVVLFESASRIQESIAKVNQQEQIVYKNLDIVRNRILGDKGKQLANETRILFYNWRPIREEVITLVKAGNKSDAAQITIEKGANHVAALEEKMLSLTNYARNKASTFMSTSSKASSRHSTLSIIFFSTAIFLTSLIALVTFRKTRAAENEIQKSRQLLMNAIDYAPIGMVLVKPEGMFHKVNESFCAMTGYSEQELLGMNFQELTHPDDHDIGFGIVKQLINKELDKAVIEKRYVRKDGNLIDVYLTTTLLRDGKGDPLYFFTQAIDITERKQKERESLILKTAIDQAPVGIALADENIQIYYCNPEGLGMRGGDTQELVEIPKGAFANWQVLMLNGEPYEIENLPLVRAITKGETIREDFIVRHQDGSHHICDASAYPIYEDGDIIGGMVIFLDVTEGKRAKQRVEHLNRVLRAIRDVNQLIVRERDPKTLIREGCRLMVDNRGYASALILLTDEENRTTTWAASGIASISDELNSMLNRQEQPPCCDLARKETDVIVIDNHWNVCDRCPIAGESRQSTSLCTRLTHGDHALGYLIAAVDNNIWVEAEELALFSEMAGDLAYALNFIRLGTDHEISERKRETLEYQLFQAQKMESVGRLAGGVAHDYNNMLSIIIGYAELAMEKVEPAGPLYAEIVEILDAARRSSDITRQLLGFARQQTTAPKVLDLNDNIESMLKMLRRLIGEDIDLEWFPASDLWSVKIDPSQIDQILANLCVNAKDAIAGVGKITIETENVIFEEEYCNDHAGFLPGEYVLLAVSDTGHGISSDMLDNIFEPFFTTKKLHQGTGLGLSTVYGIVKQNNGFINAYSEQKKGTTLKIYLPRHVGQVAEVRRETIQEIPASQGETVLLVEDDPSILKLSEKILKSLGYSVLSANSPNEAMATAKRHAGKIHILVTDVVMPEMNGRELSVKLQKQHSNLKTLFMSGYTANVIAHRGVLEDGVHFIAKPLSKKELAKKVRETLDTAP